MSGLPRISGRECVKALAKVGFYLKRQEGSHMILRRNDPFTVTAQVVIARSDFCDEAISQSTLKDCFAPLAMTRG